MIKIRDGGKKYFSLIYNLLSFDGDDQVVICRREEPRHPSRHLQHHRQLHVREGVDLAPHQEGNFLV